jgi:hypothetical protein
MNIYQRMLYQAPGEGGAGETAEQAAQRVAQENARFQSQQRPTHVPEKFWKDGKLLDTEVFKSYGELETKLKTKDEDLRKSIEADMLKARPEKPDAYKLPKIEGFTDEQVNKNPIVGLWRNLAHANGVSQEAFEKGMAEYQKVAASMNTDVEAEKKLLGENSEVRINAVSTWAEQTFTDPEEFAAVQQIATTAAGVKALERIMGGKPIIPGGGDDPDLGGEKLTPELLKSWQNDPRYWKTGEQDKAFIAKVDAGYAKLYPPKAKA